MWSFLQKSTSRQGRILNSFQNRTYFTGNRYSGFVNYFNTENLFGFVCRDDSPEQEYYFHVTDLHAEAVPRVRPLQQVEFGILEGRGGSFTARDITAPGGNPVSFSHSNLKLSKENRVNLLSSLPNALTERHTGVVVITYPERGFGLLVPDRLNYATVRFQLSEIQATGGKRLENLSEVEFFVRPGRPDRVQGQGSEPSDVAVCITRKGGHLITAERKETGMRRRMIGAMYTPKDVQAKMAAEFKTNRQLGYISSYDSDKLFGFIVPFDDPSRHVFVHLDDCHMCGPRFLSRFMAVEFFITTDDSGKEKAVHVTAPQMGVLRPRSDNRYTPEELLTKTLDSTPGKRHRGEIVKATRTFNVVKPHEFGFRPVIAFTNRTLSLGRNFHAGDQVEFQINENDDQSPTDETGRQRLLLADRITAPTGKPLLLTSGMYGRYLQSKLFLPLHQAELPEIDTNPDTVLTGFICGFNMNKKLGSIEIEAPENERYRKVLFSLDNCELPPNMTEDQLYTIPIGHKVQFRVKLIDDQNNVFDDDPEADNEDRPSRNVSLEAVSVASFEDNFLLMREAVQNRRGGRFSKDQQQDDDQEDEQGFMKFN